MESKEFVQAGICGKKAIAEIFQPGMKKAAKTEGRRVYTAAVDGHTFTVSYQPARRLLGLCREHLLYDCLGYDYRAEEAIWHILPAEEVNRRAEAKYGESYYNSDAWQYAEPELDTDALDKMPREEMHQRLACFAAICNRAASSEALQTIAELMPKKKNGTLCMGRPLFLAPLMGVSWACKIAVLAAKATSDSQITVDIHIVNFSLFTLQELEETPLLRFIMHGKEPGNDAGYPQKTEVPIYFEGRNVEKEGILLPAVRLEDGQLALDMEPPIPFSSFRCLHQTDNGGYRLVIPESFPPKEVLYRGKPLPVFIGPLSTESSGLRISFGIEWGKLEMYQKIFQGGKRFRENCQMLKSDIYGLRDREIALQDFMQNFVDKQVMLQLAFELFSMADTIQAYIENLDFQQLIDNAPAADNGNFTRWYWWYCLLDTEKEQGINGKTAMRADDVFAFMENARFLQPKNPLVVPFAVWTASAKKGLIFQGFRTEFRWDWQKGR